MILLSDPQIVPIRTADNGEPLVDLRDVPGLWLDGRLRDDHGASPRLRATVVERLAEARDRLPRGVRLLVVEAYRPCEPGVPLPATPHSTGGAVDLTLCTDHGVELDLGTAVGASPAASANACYTAARNISTAARRNRVVLYRALSRVGLTNDPTEWWHWSYGDRFWALNSGVPNTLYGQVTADLLRL